MKKVIVIISVVAVLAIFLVGCSGQSIEYTADFKPIENISDENLYVQFGNLFHSRESLDKFYENDIFQSVDKNSELEKYDDNYFKDKSLLIVMYLGDKNSSKKITAITVKDNQLWVNVKTTSMKEFNEISRFFVEVEKQSVKNIAIVNYKMLTVV